MKRRTIHQSTLLLFPALIVLFSFTGRFNGPLPGGPGRPIGRIDPATDSVREAIQQIALQFKEAFISGDSTLLLKCYAADACVMAPNGPTLCGQKGQSQFFKITRQAGIRDAVFTSLGIYGQTPEYVTEQGVFEVFDANQHSMAKGKVLILYKKTNQGWRMFRHMLNFDAPMVPRPASSSK